MTPAPPSVPPPGPDNTSSRAERRAGVEAAPLDPNDPHAPAPGQVREFLDDAKRFWAANGSWIATTLLIFAVVFGGYNLLQSRKANQREQAWSDLYSVNSQNLVNLVTDAHSGTVHTLAQLRGGDLALAEHQKLTDPSTGTQLLDQAQSRYEAALNSAPHDIYKLNALDGLGVVAESRRDADAARKHYETLKQTAGDRFPSWTARTDRRLAMLDELPAPVRFAPAPEPAEPADADADTEPTDETNIDESEGGPDADAASDPAADGIATEPGE